MPNNNFEDSRISEGTLKRDGNAVGPSAREPLVNEPGISQAEVGAGRSIDVDSGISRTTTDDVIREGAGHNASANKVGMDEAASQENRYRRVLSAGTLAGDRVRNTAKEDLGKVEEIMIDVESGRVAYVVISFGGFLGIGDKLFAVPWSALQLDEGEHEFVLDVDRQTLENAPGFDKGNWPDMADPSFGQDIHQHYGQQPYWLKDTTDAGDYIGDNRQPNRSMEYEPTIGYRAGK